MATAQITRGAVLAGRYRVIRRLGAGGMATVFLAEDERLGREVAVKRLNTGAPVDALRRFEREARLGAALNHPNLVSVFDTFTGEVGALIVMEYVPGRSLEELKRDAPVPPEDAIPILRAVAEALDHAHEQGVVHRDIKPSNVLLRDDGMVKVADLGIARAMDATQITAEGKVIGTLPYIAPERLAGAGAGGPASDVYALAALAYEILSGRSLREGFATARAASEPADLRGEWPGGPRALITAIERGLAADPRDRQETAGELVDDIERALHAGDAPTSPMPQVPPRPVFRPPGSGPRRRSPAGARLALVLLGLAILAGVGIALAGGGDDGSAPVAEKQEGGKKESAAEQAPTGSAEAEGSPDVGAPGAGLDSAGGASLNEQGFALIEAGRPEEAVPILERAVASFPPGTTDLNYAYALFNLGNALRLSGRPEEAIPILERRLEIPNQREVVAAELAQARAEAGRD